MKKYIIPIMMLLPLTMQAQSAQTEQQQLEEAQKQLEAAQKALKIAKMKAEAARLKAQADSMNQTTPSIANEPKSPSQGWAVPTATKKQEVKKAPTKVNGVELKEDPKYLEGAVTLNSAGRVEFVLDTNANGKTAKQIYDIVYQYMSNLTQGKDNIASRMALINPDEHVIANNMDEWIVFKNSALSLDRTEFKYQLVAKISNNHLQLSLSRIIYNYEEGRSTGFKEPAEEVIVDKVALTKKKNDLAKIFGKFRKFTIDRKDQIFNEITALVKG